MNKQLATEVIAWHTNNGGYCQVQEQKFHALRLLHEAAELCLACGSTGMDIAIACIDEVGKHIERHGPNPVVIPVAIDEEIADVAILLEVFAFYAAASIDDAVKGKLDVLHKREWNVDEHGVLWRKKETA